MLKHGCKIVLGVLMLMRCVELNGQYLQPDSLKVWVEAVYADSLHQVTLIPKIANTTELAGYYYYQIRITDATLRPGNLKEKINGAVFVPSFDTTSVMEKIIHYEPNVDFNVFFYLQEEEFVVKDTVWNFDDNYSALKNTPRKPKAQQAYLSKDDFEIDGLILNETKTPFGKTFHQKFMDIWQPPPKISGYWVTIRETLTPGRFTLISVSLNNKELFQRYLVPRPDYINDLAQQTVEYVLSLLQNGSYDGSLTTDDLFGKGIE